MIKIESILSYSVFKHILAIQEARPNTKLRIELLAQGKHPGNNFVI